MYMKDYPLRSLIPILLEAQVCNGTFEGARQTLHYWMRKGRLTLRRYPASKRYAVNPKEIQQIIKAFSPDGKGEWHAKGVRNT